MTTITPSSSVTSLVASVSDQNRGKVEDADSKLREEEKEEQLKVRKEVESLEDFPVGVLENVLGRLSIRSILRLRATSRVWKAIIEDVQLPTFAPWCIVSFPGPIERTPLMYDLAEKMWHYWSLPLFRTHEIVSCAESFLLLEDYELERAIITNPFSDCPLQEIPKIVSEEPSCEGSEPVVALGIYHNAGRVSALLVDKRTSPPSFKIIKHHPVWTEGYNGTLEVTEADKFVVYDSKTNEWESGYEFNPRLFLLCGHPVMHNGRLYYLKGGDNLRGEDTIYQLVVYDLALKKSNVVQSRMPGRFRFVFLFENRGRLMLFGALWASRNLDGAYPVQGEYPSVCVWLLEEETMNWIEVQRMPEDLLWEFVVTIFPYEACCAASGDYLCLLDKKQRSHLLMCNLKEKTWSIIPLGDSVGKHGLVDLVMFQPRINALDGGKRRYNQWSSSQNGSNSRSIEEHQSFGCEDYKLQL
ncbi:hypothetical protein Mapa_002257 [Marchantia paleacea]|nr:hypothetical protein Mapa_002257 [Marchantia paleacea]